MELGEFKDGREFEWTLDRLWDEFQANTYNALSRNCNHFTDALSMAMLGVHIPAYINW